MPPTSEEAAALREAIRCYDYPCVVYDSRAQMEVSLPRIRDVERLVGKQLHCKEVQTVRDGLANVLYWGHASAGYRDYRVKRFQGGIKPSQIDNFIHLVDSGQHGDLKKLADLKMPEFSGVSFLSKITMFLDPVHYCVLDRRVSSMAGGGHQRALDQLKLYSTRIPPTAHNASIYRLWCAECREISRRYFNNRYRAVDVERGLFQMLGTKQHSLARRIYEQCC